MSSGVPPSRPPPPTVAVMATTMVARVLVVDDKENFLALFRRIAPRNVEIVCASDGARALELLTTEAFDLVVSDVRMPGADGMTLLRKVRDAGLDVDVILMTAYGTITDAVKAMKLGASEYLTKPFDPDEAVRAIEGVLERRRARKGDAFEGRKTNARTTLPPMHLVGHSAAMLRVFEQIERAALSDAPVLVAGESGTGKELIARSIHSKSNLRSSRRFVPVSCGALGDAVGAELFGSIRGAASPSPPFVRGGVGAAVAARRGAFEEASGGTLFLDEVEVLPLVVQASLTKAIEERLVSRLGSSEQHSIDARLIAATDVELATYVERGRFRAELYDRLNVFLIDVPPLRARREDIPVLVEAFLKRAASAFEDVRVRSCTQQVLDALFAYDWPGNVRELENVIARAVAVAPVGDFVDVDSLPTEITQRVSSSSSSPKSSRSSSTPAALPPTSSVGSSEPTPTPASDVDDRALASLPYREAIAGERDRATRRYLIVLLESVQGNVTQAAERAGVERESFHRLMKKHGVRAEDYRPK